MCFSTGEQHANKQHKRREGKRPDLQRYQPVPGQGRRRCESEEGEAGHDYLLNADSSEHDQPSQSERKSTSENVPERHGCSDGGMDTNHVVEDRRKGDGRGNQNCTERDRSHAKTEANLGKGVAENNSEQQEPAGAARPMKKARKPDREIYQPGSRRNIQGKDCGVGSELDKPTKRHDPKTELNPGDKERNKTKYPLKPGQKDQDVKDTQKNVKQAKSSEGYKKHGSQDGNKPPLPTDSSVEKMSNKIEKLSIKEQGSTEDDVEKLSSRRGETTDIKGRGQGGGPKEEEEKEKKRERGNRRRRGGEKERERNQDTSRAENDEGGGGKRDRYKTEKERERKTPEANKDNKPGKQQEETHQGKGRENCRENRRGDNNNNNRSRDAEKDSRTKRNVDKPVHRGDRNKPSANITTPTSKRYSKSDIRRPRNRTYSSSSASSVTSLDGPGRGMEVESTKWLRLESRMNNKESMANSGEGQRSHLPSWTTNGESSTESLDGSEFSDVAEDRRRRRRVGEAEQSSERRREERNRPKGNKGGCRGILKVSLEKQVGTSPRGGLAQQGSAPRGRGGGILVLPTRTDVSNPPEAGQRLLFGGIRGGATGRSRGGRGGGVRRLWDPNNPDQKPALASSQSLQLSSLQQPVYLQTGTGYGQLHFLDTDDEVAGSPPVPQGENFRSQQAAAMAYYKFQKSDNPYFYPMPTSNAHSPGNPTNQRYPYPYQMGPYQMGPSNGLYSGPGMNQFCGSYKGAGYAQTATGAGLTSEEAEQQARGELGRLLRAADTQELQLSNLLSRDRVSADGLDRMAQLR